MRADNQIIENYLLDIKLGNLKSLENLFNETKSMIYGLAFSILKNTSDSEDVTQDVYINIYRNIDKYEAMNKPFAWIFTITRNLCLEKIRKRKKEIYSSLEEVEHLIISNHQEAIYNKELLECLLEKLTDEERQIIILISQGFKFKEIANILNLNLSTVLSKYHRAKLKIRRSNYE